MVEVVAGGDVQQGGGFTGADVLHEYLHVPAVLDVQRCGQLAVGPVVHHHVHHAASVVHHDVQLLLSLLIGVADLDEPGHAAGLIQQIAPGGSQNGVALGAEQGNVLDHHLTADAGDLAQGGAGEGRFALFHQLQDLLPALIAI